MRFLVLCHVTVHPLSTSLCVSSDRLANCAKHIHVKQRGWEDGGCLLENGA